MPTAHGEFAVVPVLAPLGLDHDDEPCGASLSDPMDDLRDVGHDSTTPDGNDDDLGESPSTFRDRLNAIQMR